jgi:hypothetical protein
MSFVHRPEFLVTRKEDVPKLDLFFLVTRKEDVPKLDLFPS